MFKILFLTLLLPLGLLAQNQSVYTPISNKQCQVVTTSPASGYLKCPGAGGYSLEVLDDDARMSVNVVAPDTKTYELDFWGFFRRFSFVGEQAEWRMKGGKPVALIVRYSVDDGSETGKNIAYLMVSKITPTKSCLVGIIKPGKSQNVLARNLADTAGKKPCKQIED